MRRSIRPTRARMPAIPTLWEAPSQEAPAQYPSRRQDDPARRAMKQGTYDDLFKPLDLHQVRRVLDEAPDVSRRLREPAVLAEDVPHGSS